MGTFVEKMRVGTGSDSFQCFSQYDLIIISNFRSVTDVMSSKTSGKVVPTLLARSRVVSLNSLAGSGVTAAPAISFKANCRNVDFPFDDRPYTRRNRGPLRSTRPTLARRVLMCSWKKGDARKYRMASNIAAFCTFESQGMAFSASAVRMYLSRWSRARDTSDRSWGNGLVRSKTCPPNT